MTVKKVFPLLVVLLVAILTGCNTGDQVSKNNPVIIVDDMGREVTLDAEPERIISIAPSSTEIIYALGLGDKVVGVDDFSDYPADAKEVGKVGGYSDPNIEKIVSLKPDLVLAESAHEQVVGQMEEMGIAVIVLFPKSIEDIYGNIELVGEAAGAQEAAAVLVEEMRGRINAVRNKLKDIPEKERIPVYYEVYHDPLMTVGPETVVSNILEASGGRNIFRNAVTDYPQLSAEVIIERNPGVIMFPAFHGSASLTVESVLARDGWEIISAVKNGRIYGIDANIISRAGPRVAEAVEEAAKMMYPELFEK